MLARFEREKHDLRINGLTDYIAIFSEPLPRHGVDGAYDVAASLCSARHWRNLRAKSLLCARKQQLMEHRPSVRFWLAKAAEQRLAEKRLRKLERRAEFFGKVFAAAHEMEAAE